MSCLRCGRKADASFCDECLKLVSMPLPDSPYLNTQINLKTKKTSRPVIPIKEEKKTVSHKGYIVAIVILSVLCAALVCACLWFGRKEIALWLS